MDRTCELLALGSFSGYLSSSACIENRNHFHRHRDQILIGSLVNSKQVNGENCKKKHLQPGCRCTCTLAITTSPPQKNSPDLHQPQEWSLAKAGGPPRGDAPGHSGHDNLSAAITICYLFI